MHKIRKAAAVVAACLLLAAPARAETLTNDDVIQLVKSGLSETLVRKKIATSDCRFDMSAARLVELKEAGVPEGIIELMVDTHTKWKARITGAVQVALQGFRDDTGAQRERSLRDLQRLGPDAIPEIVRQGLINEEARVRSGAAEAIGLMGHRDGMEPLLEALTDRDAAVRTVAAAALKATVEDGERERVCKRLLAVVSGIDKPADGAVRALGHLGEKRAAPDLRKMAQADTAPAMRAAAAEALGAMRDAESLDLLIDRLLADRSAEVRGAAALALARIGDAKAVKPLVKAFERYPQDRRQLVGPLARFRDPEGVETLIEALDDDDARVKDMAWDALKLLTGETSLKKDRSIWNEWWELEGRKRF
jgi:HEAT repeat protein